jgi:eukaryotic-like serine/threonine-protein kinase
MANSSTHSCSQCGASLNDGTPDGMCVRCLLSTALLPPPEDQAWLSSAGSPEALLKRRMLGGYELLSEIARGGMGVVFHARQQRPMRDVALKVIVSGALSSAPAVERFRTEAQAAARLEHPNIASIYEVGEEDGWHYFSMRLVQGGTLAQRLASARMAPREAARMAIKIARAVHHAHQRAVLHRDLKPSNVLLDQAGEPHLTDFGLAKIAELDSALTHSTAIFGTPAYMAPEQAAGGAREITIAADVYGLGVLFYEMLAARLPFPGTNHVEVLRKVCDLEPEPLPTAIPRDLRTICLRCLEKDPARRYASAAEFADDLERWQHHVPILARPSSGWDRLVKWARRKPALAARVATAGRSLLIIVVSSLSFNVQLSQANAFAQANANHTRQRLISEHLREAARLTAEDDGLMAMLPLVEALKLEGPDGSSSRRLAATLSFSPHLLRLWNAEGAPLALRFSADGKRLVAVLQDGAKAWDLASGERVAPQQDDPFPAEKNQLPPRTSADGRWQLSIASGGLALTEIATGRVTKTVSVSGPIFDFGFSPDSGLFATATWRDQVRVFALPNGEMLHDRIKHESGANRVVFSPDGRLLATAGFDYRLRLWNTDDLRAAAPALRHNALVEAVCFSADARFLASADADGVVKVWDLYAPAAKWCERGALGQSSPFSPDGRTIIVPDGSDRVWFWDAATGRAAAEPLAVRPGVIGAMFDSTGTRAVTWGAGAGVTVWDLASRTPMLDLPTETKAAHVFWREAERELFIVSGDGMARRRGVPQGEVIGPEIAHGGEGHLASLSGDGCWLAVASGQTVTVWDISTGARLGEPLRGPDRVIAIQFSHDSRRLAVAYSNLSIEPLWAQIFELPSLRPALPPLRHGDGTFAAAFSPDDAIVATGGEDNIARLWRTSDGTPAAPGLRHAGIVNVLTFAPDGRTLISGSHDWRTRLWDTARGELMAPSLDTPHVEAIVISPAGTHFVAGISGRRPFIVPIAAETLPLPVWARFAECATGCRLTEAAGYVPLSARELAERFESLRAEHPTRFTWPSDSGDWHHFHAKRAEALGQRFTAEFHGKLAR